MSVITANYMTDLGFGKSCLISEVKSHFVVFMKKKAVFRLKAEYEKYN